MSTPDTQSRAPLTYRVETRWPSVSRRWAFVPEDHGVTLARARQIVRKAAHWQPCGLQQRIVANDGTARVVSTYRSQLASPKRRAELRRLYLPEIHP